MKAIERRLVLESSVDDVWRALTDPTEVAGWFPDRAQLGGEAGSEGWFEWETHGRFAMRVEEFDPPRRFAWRWSRDAGTSLDDGPSTLVEWTLTPREGGGTVLDLRESGFQTEKHLESNTGGWDHELAELEEYLATG